jgi:hypothetical protein
LNFCGIFENLRRLMVAAAYLAPLGQSNNIRHQSPSHLPTTAAQHRKQQVPPDDLIQFVITLDHDSAAVTLQ